MDVERVVRHLLEQCPHAIVAGRFGRTHVERPFVPVVVHEVGNPNNSGADRLSQGSQLVDLLIPGGGKCIQRGWNNPTTAVAEENEFGIEVCCQRVVQQRHVALRQGHRLEHAMERVHAVGLDSYVRVQVHGTERHGWVWVVPVVLRLIPGHHFTDCDQDCWLRVVVVGDRCNDCRQSCRWDRRIGSVDEWDVSGDQRAVVAGTGCFVAHVDTSRLCAARNRMNKCVDQLANRDHRSAVCEGHGWPVRCVSSA